MEKYSNMMNSNVEWLGESWCVPPRKAPARAKIPVCPQHWGKHKDDRCKACNIAEDGVYPALPAKFYTGALVRLETGRVNEYTKEPEFADLKVYANDASCAVIIIDPESGSIRIAKPIALCQDSNGRDWAAVSYFIDGKAAKDIYSLPLPSDFDEHFHELKCHELIEDCEVVYVDLNNVFDTVIISTSKDKEILHKTRKRFPGKRIYLCNKRFSSKSGQMLSATVALDPGSKLESPKGGGTGSQLEGPAVTISSGPKSPKMHSSIPGTINRSNTSRKSVR